MHSDLVVTRPVRVGEFATELPPKSWNTLLWIAPTLYFQLIGSSSSS
jgi:cytochrome c-type biogenesis protein CcmH/NrfF